MANLAAAVAGYLLGVVATMVMIPGGDRSPLDASSLDPSYMVPLQT